MNELPSNSVIHIDREAGFDRVVMSYPTSLSARVGTSIILGTVFLVAGYFWQDAIREMFSGRVGFDEIMTLVFTSLVMAFMGLMGSRALRRRIPESVMVVGDGIIHDSGVDPYRRTAVEQDPIRQQEQFMKARKRMSFSRAEVRSLAKTDVPYPNRIYIEADGQRYNLGEGLSVEERAWLYDYLVQQLQQPGAVSSEANRLIAEVEAAEEDEPMITDVHSGHRVDPLDFDDPVARKAEWGSIADSSANFQTHSLVSGRGRMAFKATRFARVFAWSFPWVGLFVLGLSGQEFIRSGVAAESIFLALVGCIFLIAGLYLVRMSFEPVVFNLRTGMFRKGWSNPALTPLSEIYGLQLLAFISSGEGIHTGYEMNLLLRDSSRLHVICHGDADTLRRDAASLGRFLGRPVFDGIRK